MAKQIRVPKVKKPLTPKDRLLTELQRMPDEAFGWVLFALIQKTWPDGLGGFQDESRISIERAKLLAADLIAIGSRRGLTPEGN